MSRLEWIAFIVTAAIAVLVVAGYLVHPYVTPCAEEDSVNCVWVDPDTGDRYITLTEGVF